MTYCKEQKHTITETLDKPCSFQIVKTVLGKQQKKYVCHTTSSEIKSEMSFNILTPLMEELKKVTLPFGLQLDESTDDEPKHNQLSSLVRYPLKHASPKFL